MVTRRGFFGLLSGALALPLLPRVAAPVAAYGGLEDSTYRYAVTFVHADGVETKPIVSTVERRIYRLALPDTRLQLIGVIPANSAHVREVLHDHNCGNMLPKGSIGCDCGASQ